VARAAAIVALVGVIASEGVSLIRGQRLRARIPALEVSDLARVRLEYERIGRGTLVGLGRWQVAGPLAERLTQMADEPIQDYRHARAPVAQAQWERAREALDFAVSLEPGNMAVASRRAYVRGQLARIGRRYPEAIRLFNDAARLDPASVDPYLGLSAVHAYGTRDLPALTTAIANAERRGFQRGQRESAEFGDLHLALGEEARTAARGLSGVERIEPLERAVAAYANCIKYFSGLTLGDSQRNLRTCQQRLSEAQAQLPAPASPAPFTGNEP
jgi:tetratricopeptide (TPR) repeat protein